MEICDVGEALTEANPSAWKRADRALVWNIGSDRATLFARVRAHKTQPKERQARAYLSVPQGQQTLFGGTGI